MHNRHRPSIRQQQQHPPSATDTPSLPHHPPLSVNSRQRNLSSCISKGVGLFFSLLVFLLPNTPTSNRKLSLNAALERTTQEGRKDDKSRKKNSKKQSSTRLLFKCVSKRVRDLWRDADGEPDESSRRCKQEVGDGWSASQRGSAVAFLCASVHCQS
jgi:hypothetical protein